MKNKLFAFLTLALLSTLDPQLSTLFAQGTAFTYQGRLNDNGNPASGSYDVTFRVWNAASGPAQVGGTLTNANTAVSNGLFTVTLDFGANFPGADRWLEIGVRTNGNGTFFILSPRQKITPSPYAIYAAGASAAGISGTIPTANLTGTYGSAVTFSKAANSFSGNGTGLTNVNATTLGGLGAANFWVVGGIASGVVSNMAFSTSGTNAITAAAQANNVAMGVITNGVFRVFNVMDYGAVPDGITDCTAAIQSAVDAAIASGSNGFALSKTIYFPLKNHITDIGTDSSVTANTYKILGTINVPAAGLTFRGEVQSINEGATTLFHTNNSPCFLISGGIPNGNITTFEDLLIQGNGEANPANAGIVFTRGSQPLIKNCGLFWIGTGLVFSNSIYPMVESCSLNSCGLGIRFVGTTQAKVSNTDFSESNQGIKSDGGVLSVDNCMFGGFTHDNGPMTNAIWITADGAQAQVSVSARF